MIACAAGTGKSTLPLAPRKIRAAGRIGGNN